MKLNQEYLDSISKKLDAFNQMNGFEPKQGQISSGGFDLMNGMGKAALDYLARKRQEEKETPIGQDPLFGDHN